MLNRIKLFFNILSVVLIIFVITSNAIFAEPIKEAANFSHGAGGQILMMVVLFGFMYFLLIRPQNKKAKEHRDLIANIVAGDEIVTVGGLLGKVEKVLDHFLMITITNNVTVMIQKPAVIQILPKDTIKNL